MSRVHLTNWDKAGKLFTVTVPRQLEHAVDEAFEEAQRIYMEEVLRLISEQPSSWTRKSNEWRNRSGSPRLFIGYTGEFVSKLSSEKNTRRGLRASRGDKRVFVGARHDVYHHTSGFSMKTIAEILQSIPDGSRSLFPLAYERAEGRIRKVFRDVGTKIKF